MNLFEDLRSLDDLDEPRELRFVETGLPLWPYIRWQAFAEAQELAFGHERAFAAAPPATVRDRLELVARAALRGAHTVRRPFDVAIVTSSAGAVIQRAGRWFDRINDYFALELPQRTLVLDRALHGGYKTPRVPPHVRCFEGLELAATLRARRRRLPGADAASIDRLLQFVRDRFPVTLPEPVFAGLRATLVHWALRLPLLRGAYERFFARTRPRVLLIEDASYGALAHLCRWARDAGIVTAEPQHGVISRSHLAYNWGDAARADDAIASCLPRHLLLYGDLWRDEVRTSSQLDTVGCPHFSESTARPGGGGEPIVLVISQGVCTTAMVEITTKLAAQYPGRQFVFRLHPGEVPFKDRYESLATLSNVAVSDRGDIYELLARAELAIGYSSTALVEAAGMGIPVCVLDDPGSRSVLPAGIGTWFETAEDLAPAIEQPPARATDAQRFFAPQWRERYRAFLAGVGVAT